MWEHWQLRRLCCNLHACHLVWFIDEMSLYPPPFAGLTSFLPHRLDLARLFDGVSTLVSSDTVRTKQEEVLKCPRNKTYITRWLHTVIQNSCVEVKKFLSLFIATLVYIHDINREDAEAWCQDKIRLDYLLHIDRLMDGEALITSPTSLYDVYCIPDFFTQYTYSTLRMNLTLYTG